MKILIKCTRLNINQTIEIPDDGSITTIDHLKAYLSKSFSFGPSPRLIFAGHILKDHQTLSEVGFKEGSTLYIVASPAAATTTTTTTPTPAPINPNPTYTAPQQQQQQQPLFPGPGGMGNNMGIPGMNMSPKDMRQMMDSPMVKHMLNNPELIKSMLLSDPRMKRMYESNPQVAAVLDDPAELQQIVEAIRNPELMAHMQATAERSMNQLENIPEAYRAMQRLFNSMNEAEAGVELDSIRQRPVDVPEAPTGPNPTEAPLPNPWGNPQPQSQPPQQQQQQTQSQQNSGMPFNAGQNGGFNFGNLFGQQDPNGFGGMDMGALLENPMMQSMMQQFAENPQLMMSMMEANPSMKAMMDSNPMLRSILSNPEYVKQMFTPENLRMASQAMNSGAFQGMGMGMPPMGGFPGMGMGAYQQQQQQPPQQQQQFYHQQPMMYTAGAGAQQGGNGVPLEERYKEQLKVLEDMGFLDKEKNLRALSATNGSVQLAIEKLLAGF